MHALQNKIKLLVLLIANPAGPEFDHRIRYPTKVRTNVDLKNADWPSNPSLLTRSSK